MVSGLYLIFQNLFEKILLHVVQVNKSKNCQQAYLFDIAKESHTPEDPVFWIN